VSIVTKIDYFKYQSKERLFFHVALLAMGQIPMLGHSFAQASAIMFSDFSFGGCLSVFFSLSSLSSLAAFWWRRCVSERALEFSFVMLVMSLPSGHLRRNPMCYVVPMVPVYSL
jgi:hypothetical protein